MQQSTPGRQRAILEMPLADFQHQIQQLLNQEEHSPTGSLLSRLALIHQVAKACVTAEIGGLDAGASEIEIDEITDPPMYEVGPENGVVIIQYSYVKSGQNQTY